MLWVWPMMTNMTSPGALTGGVSAWVFSHLGIPRYLEQTTCQKMSRGPPVHDKPPLSNVGYAVVVA